MIPKDVHQRLSLWPTVVVVGCFFASCELPPEEIIEPDFRTVTLLFTGSIQGELQMCD